MCLYYNPNASKPLTRVWWLCGFDAADRGAGGVRSGKPCFVGTRMAVCDVLEYLASGMTTAEIVRDFPELTEAHVRAAIEFAAIRERRLATPA